MCLVKHLYATTQLLQHTWFDCCNFLPQPLLFGACGCAIDRTDGLNANTLLLRLLNVPSWRHNNGYRGSCRSDLDRLRLCSCIDATGFAICQLQWLVDALSSLRLAGPGICHATLNYLPLNSAGALLEIEGGERIYKPKACNREMMSKTAPNRARTKTDSNDICKLTKTNQLGSSLSRASETQDAANNV